MCSCESFPIRSSRLGIRYLMNRHGHTAPVNRCAISPDGTWIVSASEDHTLKVWDSSTGDARLTLVGHTDAVNDCAISPDGTWIVSASDDKTLKIWDAFTGTKRLT